MGKDDYTQLLTALSILIVDDDPAILEGMKRLLARVVGTVYAATNGQEGIECFNAYKPDVVISDIRMPVMDGLEMARVIRELSSDHPIAIISAHDDTRLLLKSIDIGIDKYLLKPVRTDLLIRWLGQVAHQISMKNKINIQVENIHFIIDHNPDGICLVDDGEISYLNPTLLRLFHLDSFDDFDKSRDCICDLIVNDDGSRRFADLSEMEASLAQYQGKDMLVKSLSRGAPLDEMRAYNLCFKLYPQIRRTILIFTDITAIVKERSMLKVQANTDTLTNISNRLHFDRLLEQKIASSRREDRPFSLIMFDIDDFKRVNDIYGHLMGDKILVELTKAVSSIIRKGDLFARWGGEEFVILTQLDTNNSALLAEKLAEVIRTHIFDTVGKITCSFGISTFEKEDTAETLLEKVDRALYSAKGLGKDRVQVYMASSNTDLG